MILKTNCRKHKKRPPFSDLHQQNSPSSFGFTAPFKCDCAINPNQTFFRDNNGISNHHPLVQKRSYEGEQHRIYTIDNRTCTIEIKIESVIKKLAEEEV